MADNGYKGSLSPDGSLGQYNELVFVIRQLLNKVNTMTLVQVKKVNAPAPGAPVGSVSVQPMINMLDGSGNQVPYPVIHNLPYFRIQGGANAVIIDPQVNDIGLAVFAQHDISAAKATRAQANPGSRRRFDLADGLYIGGFLNAAPTQYVQMDTNGVKVVSPTAVHIEAPAITAGANGATLHPLVTDALVTWASNHTHTCAAAGSPSSTPIQPISGATTTNLQGA